jgi:RNA polymerase sigma-70 factor, ECF subfamily
MDWNSIIEDYYDRIYAYCFQFLGSPADAEEATQDTFLKAYRSRTKLKQASSIKSWIYSIACRTCIDRKRWWKRQLNFLNLNLSAGDQPPAEAAAPNPDLKLFLRDLISNLPAKQKEVFLLRHWHNFSTAETAALLGISAGTVKSHLSRAVDNIKSEILASEKFSSRTTNSESRSSLPLT